jgi:ABC-2 type transport system ATP-binding protein
MKQKLALSCALIHTPRLLLLDEPTTGVDPVSRRDFWEMLERLRARGVTIVVSTPYMNEAALCGHMVFIHKGEILASGTAGEITALFEGTVIAAEGPDLHAIAARLKSAVEPELVRILGDAVQVLALGGRRGEVGALVEAMRREGVVTRSGEIPPGIEDTFVSLMRE